MKEDVPEGYYDREQMIQVFVTLIFNAAEVMPDGGNIYISTQAAINEKLSIIFEDTGLGIEEKNIEKYLIHSLQRRVKELV